MHRPALTPILGLFLVAAYAQTAGRAASRLGMTGRVGKPLAACPVKGASGGEATPSSWQRVDAKGRFSFYLPPDMKKQDVRGIDSFSWEFGNGRLFVSFDHEPEAVLVYERRENEYGKGYQESEVKVDGRKAFIFVHQDKSQNPNTYNADLFVGDLPKGQVKLHMWSVSTEPADVEIATRIFCSVDFP